FFSRDAPSSRDLHSFPTRRSSDLAAFADQGQGFATLDVEGHAIHHPRPAAAGFELDGQVADFNHVFGLGHFTSSDRRHHAPPRRDRKSTRLNSSHVKNSYAVFCLK